MHPTELLNILHTAEKLKDTTRHCDTSGGPPRKRGGTQLAHRADGIFPAG